MGDIEVSCQITNNDDGMFHVKIIEETVHGSSAMVRATKIGKKQVQIKQ